MMLIPDVNEFRNLQEFPEKDPVFWMDNCPSAQKMKSSLSSEKRKLR
jgi:hypothetical protein